MSNAETLGDLTDFDGRNSADTNFRERSPRKPTQDQAAQHAKLRRSVKLALMSLSPCREKQFGSLARSTVTSA